MKTIGIAVAALIIYLGVIFTVTKVKGVGGSNSTILFAALATIGVTGAAIFLIFKKKMTDNMKVPPAAPAAGGPVVPGGTDEVDVLVKEAEQRLAAAKLAQGANVSGLPVVFILGEQGTTKTSTMIASGIEPELLSGQVYHDNRVAPTRTANFWFARQTVFAELGGSLLVDQTRWINALKKLQPGNLKSVVGGGGQAPRVAVVCFDAETFTRPDAANLLSSAGRVLQARLGEMSQTYGINLPVYVLFTKIDRVPFFAEYVRNLSNEESTQVFGATIPIRPKQGIYAEEETRRLTHAFNELFYSLCDRRVVFLPREFDPEKLPGAYEFPREFRKLRNSAVQFLVDVCRPSELRTSPFLRGFYFTGVRPIQVQEAAPVPSARSEQQSFEASASATTILNVKAQQAKMQAAMAASAPSSNTRRVPQWMFLSHLFNDVILKDGAALGASRTSVKASAAQRFLLGTAAALALIYLGIATWSYFGNRKLENEALNAARNIKSTEGGAGKLASLESLQELETLRQSLEKLTTYEREGAPLGLRWGLYTGSDLYPLVRKTYYNRFAQLLFGQTQADMLAYLQKVPATPGPNDDYGFAFDTLKGYLITTNYHEKSTRQFLSPLLRARWSAKLNPDNERMALATKQFDFYSEDLKFENPYSSEFEGASVEKARRYLAAFSGSERVYQFMLAEASKANKPVNFNRDIAGSAEIVLNNKDVPGAFSKGGWAFMIDAINKADKYFGGERWVLCGEKSNDSSKACEGSQAKLDLPQLRAQLTDRYTNDFIAQWKNYFKNSVYTRYTNPQDAAKKLNRVSGNQSPLLALFWLASQNTSVDSPKVQQAMQPVHWVVPPANADRYISQNTTNYVTGLTSLTNSFTQFAQQTPAPPPVVQQAQNDASGARNTVRQVALNFRIDQQDHLETTVEKLLNDPIIFAEPYLQGTEAADLNAKGKGLCMQFTGMTNKFPFNPNAQPEVTLAEMNALLKPKEGAFWAFYEGSLKTMLVKQGTQYVAQPAGNVKLTPQFVKFFNDMARFSDAMYANGTGTDPKFSYTLRTPPSDQVQSLTLNIDGQSAVLTGQTPPKQFTWPGAGGAKIDLKIVGGSDLNFQTRPGLWAIFRVFADADRFTPAGGVYNLEWVPVSGKNNTPQMVLDKPLTYRLTLDTGGAPPVFDKSYLSSLKCISTVASAK